MTINSKAEIHQRIAAGRITWAGPLLMLAVRPIFLLAGQALVHRLRVRPEVLATHAIASI